ncbi:MAG: glucose 1-dehydrogenase [Armatimonadetes bacterium]|nr:glucose 1-dehydrogenase [Armatimonadota bacterium]
MRGVSMDLFDLNGKTALVTGAASGLGRAMAIALAQAGADVVIVDLNAEEAQRVVEEICGIGRDSVAVTVNVGESSQADEMVRKTVERFGKLDIAVNNAGIAAGAPVQDMPDDLWQKIIDTDLSGVFYCCRAEAREMIKRNRGSIINIASLVASVVNGGVIGLSAYCSAKAGVKMLTKSLATDLAPFNIRVNSISPGVMNTRMNAEVHTDSELSEKVCGYTPLRRMGEPHELGGVAVFLASSASSFVTGTDILVDGGVSIW